MVYQFANRDNNIKYVTYSLATSPSKKYFLETGIENNNYVAQVPHRMFSCSQMGFSDAMMQRVNGGTQSVFVVEKTPDGYTVSPVMLVTSWEQTPEFVSYKSPDGLFTTRSSELMGTVDLADETSPSTFYYGGYYEYCDREIMMFTRTSKETCRPSEQMEIAPGVGLVTQRIGTTSEEAESNTLKLVSINGRTPDDFICPAPTAYSAVSVRDNGGESMLTESLRRTYEDIVVEGESAMMRSDDSDMMPNVTTPKSAPVVAEPVVESFCAVPQLVGTHVVQRGENIYRIAKMYGVTTAQIKGWNNLRENDIISTCTRIRIAPFEAASPDLVAKNPTPAVASKPAPKVVVAPKPAPKVVVAPKPAPKPAPKVVAAPKPAPIKVSPATKKVAPKPASVPTSYIQPSTVPADREWLKSGSCSYTVQKGETLYSIGNKYGYTADRLRYINNLGVSDVVKQGQIIAVCDCNCPNPDVKSTASTWSPPAKTSVAPDELVAKTATSTPSATTEAESSFVHVVEEGETLSIIARRYNTTVEKIRAANQLKPAETVIPYQVLYIIKG